MKKIGRKLLVFVVMASIIFGLAAGAFAQNDVNLKTADADAVFSTELSSKDLKAGDEFSVTVKLDTEKTDIASFGMKIGFDKDQVEVVKVKDKAATASEALKDLEGLFSSNVSGEEVIVGFTYSGFESRIVDSMDLFTVKFKVKEGAEFSVPNLTLTVDSCACISEKTQATPTDITTSPAVKEVTVISAETGAAFSTELSSKKLKAGDEFSVTVKLDTEKTNIASFGMIIGFDEDQVEVVKVKEKAATASEALKDLEGLFSSNVSGEEVIVGFTYSAFESRIVDSMDLFTVNFKVKENAAPGTLDLRFTVDNCASIKEKTQQSPTAITTSPAVKEETAIGKDAKIEEKVLEVDKIAVSGLAKAYKVDEAVDFTNAKATVSFKDSTETKEFALTKDNCDIDTSKEVTDKVLNVTYNNKKYASDFTYSVVKEEKKVDSVEFVAPSKTEYVEGETDTLDLSDAKWHVTYTDQTEEDFDVNQSAASGYDLAVAGQYEVKVAEKILDKDAEGEYTITVSAKTPESIEIDEQNPPQTSFKVGKAFTVETGKAIVKYNNGKEASFNLNDEAIVVDSSAYDKDTVGKYTIKVSYTLNEKTVETSYEVEVTDKVITGIEVTTKPDKTVYKEGEELDLTGGKLTASYDNDTKEVVDLTAEDVEVTGYNKAKIGSQELTVTYKGKTAKFNVTVEEITVPVIKEEPKQEVGENVPEELVECINNSVLESDTIQDRAAAVVVTKDELNKALDELELTKDEVSKVVEPVFVLSNAQVVKDGEKIVEFKVDVTPVSRVYLAETANLDNKVLIKEEEIDLTGDKVEMTIALPEGFMEDGQDAFVQHKSYEIIVQVADQKVSFINTNGFSEFGISVDTKAEAYNKEKALGYLDIQTAVDEVEEGQTLIVLKEGLSAKVGRVVSFKLEGYALNLIAEEGYVVTVKDDGTVVVTVATEKPADKKNVNTGLDGQSSVLLVATTLILLALLTYSVALKKRNAE